jgi:hypothetical protein
MTGTKRYKPGRYRSKFNRQDAITNETGVISKQVLES